MTCDYSSPEQASGVAWWDSHALTKDGQWALKRLYPRYAAYAGACLAMFLKPFQKLRENVIFPQARMNPVADLGFGVLDTAMAETVAFVLEKG